jgi:hypothetical protein
MHLTPEEATEDQFKFNTQKRVAELSDLEDDDMQTNDTNKSTTNNKQPREKKTISDIHIRGDKLQRND